MPISYGTQKLELQPLRHGSTGSRSQIFCEPTNLGDPQNNLTAPIMWDKDICSFRLIQLQKVDISWEKLMTVTTTATGYKRASNWGPYNYTLRHVQTKLPPWSQWHTCALQQKHLVEMLSPPKQHTHHNNIWCTVTN